MLRESSRDEGVDAFLNEYLVDFDRERALAAASVVTGCKRRWPLSNMLVQVEMDRKLDEHEQDCRLRASFVKNFIYELLVFKPIDHFTPCPGGGWMVTQGDYEKLPEVARQLIEDVEYRVIRGESYLAIRFVSKTKALELACRYTLTQKLDITVPAIPWDQVAKQPERIDHVQAALDEVEGEAAKAGAA